MNNLRLNVTIPLGLLTPTAPDTYSIIAKFFKASDGSPLDSVYIPNSTDVSVVTTSSSFPVDISVTDNTWTESNVAIRLFANDSISCCFATRIDDIINTISPSLSPEAVVLNQFDKISRYEPSTGNLGLLFTSDASLSPDIAHTVDRIFVYDVEGLDLVIKEYSINNSPFSHTFIRDYILDSDVYGAGLCAVSNTELYMAGYSVNKITISGTTATALEMFALPSGYSCTGDLIYDTSTELMLIAYDDMSDYRIGVFNALTGAVVRSEVAPSNDIFAIYQYTGNTYIISGTGQIYSLNLTTLVATPTTTIPITGSALTGGSQRQSNISIPA